MELLEGSPLDDVIAEADGVVPHEEVVRIVSAMLEPLAALHDAGVVHRDIKPANAFLCADGSVRLLDLGAALLPDDEEDEESRIGTPTYMPPEQAIHEGAVLTPRADVFAAGATLYHLLSGRPLRAASTVDEAVVLAATAIPGSVARVAPELPSALAAVVDRALPWNADDRWADARALRDGLQAALAASDATEKDRRATVVLAAALDRAAAVRRAQQLGDAEIREQRALLKGAFRHLSMAVASARRGLLGTEETRRRVAAMHDGLRRAAAAMRGETIWAVRPGGFAFARDTVWTPDEAVDEVPYLLFAMGVRGIGLRESAEVGDVERMVALLAALTDGNVDELLEPWIRGDVPHYTLSTVASFDVTLLERITGLETAFGDAKREIDRAMREAERDLLGGPAGQARVAEADAIARADGSAASAASPSERAGAASPATVVLDDAGPPALEALCVVTRDAVVDAIETGDLRDRAIDVRRLLEQAMPGVGVAGVVAALHFALDPLDDEQRAEVVRAVLNEPLLRAILQRGGAARTASGEVVATTPIYRFIAAVTAPDHPLVVFDPWRAFARATFAGVLGAAMLAHPERALPRIGPALGSAPDALVNAVLDHVRTLAPAHAVPVLDGASAHGSDDVRLRAMRLRLVLGLRVEQRDVSRLLRASTQRTRMEAVAALVDANAVEFAGALLEAAEAERLDALQPAERRHVLEALLRLNPDGGEEHCIALLRPQQWVDTPESSQTRRVAAEVLGTGRATPAMLDALRAEARPLLRGTPAARAAASAALEALSAPRGGEVTG